MHHLVNSMKTGNPLSVMSSFRPANAKDDGYLAWSGGMGAILVSTVHYGTH